jgi:DnaK suppressor protein
MFTSMLQLMGLAFAKPQPAPDKAALLASAVVAQTPAGPPGRTQGIKQVASQVRPPSAGATESRSLAGQAQSNESASARGQQVKTANKASGKSSAEHATKKPSESRRGAPVAAPSKSAPSVAPKQAVTKKPLASPTVAAKKSPVKALQQALPDKPKAAAKSPAKPVQKTAIKTIVSEPAENVKKSVPASKKSPALTALATTPLAQLAAPSARKPAATGPSAKPASARAAALPVPNLKTGITLVNNAASTISAPVPSKPSRSARSLSLTVPSMAQSVASTAAKSSYGQLPAPAVLVPVVQVSVVRDPKLASNWKSKPVEQLTDQEVIAMADEHYMNDTQLAFFRLKLLQLKKDILNSAGETTEHLREETVVVPDPADRATIEEEHALELRTRDRERKLLKKIEQSINLIDAGDYGYCDETGEPIGVGRLLARPTATLSLEAQQRRELRQKMFGD